jgi:pullulanase
LASRYNPALLAALRPEKEQPLKIDLFTRKQTHFVLWRPGLVTSAPALFIGQMPTGPGPGLEGFRELPLEPSADYPELWELKADACGLESGQVYLYWFKARDTNPYAPGPRGVYCTDPFAWTVDRRFPAPADTPAESSSDPASVILYRDGRLVACDPDGSTVSWGPDASVSTLPANNGLVIYELPTRWLVAGGDGTRTVGVGTFADILALLEPAATAPGFGACAVLQAGRAHLLDLGVNALELLPPADSGDRLGWGYGTANYFAADFDLGGGTPQSAPAASTGLAAVVSACHAHGLRFFTDMVMAFARDNPYAKLNFADFFVQWKTTDDPTRDPEQGARDGFGGDLFKYNYPVDGYHPITGQRATFVPAREYMKLYAAHWLEYYRVDGLRLDSVENTGSYDFLQEFKDFARGFWHEQERGRAVTPGQLEERMLVVGEEISVPIALVAQQRLDGLWNERFKHILRAVILGRAAGAEAFEASVSRLIDCRLLGFTDGAQVVNYITSHDVGGTGNERLHDYLVHNGVLDVERRVKLAFVCLLTALGIPLILAGEEFADQHDVDVTRVHDGAKQIDPVNYDRLAQPWRRRVCDYVARLVRLRTRAVALGLNDTELLHADTTEGKRVVVWQRGTADDPVVVVANFSDYGTPEPTAPEAEYFVPGFPALPAGKWWHEITQARAVPAEWAGREPIYPWEAKVYVLKG